MQAQQETQCRRVSSTGIKTRRQSDNQTQSNDSSGVTNYMEYPMEYYDDDDYYNQFTPNPEVDSPTCRDVMCVSLATVNVIIFVLGIVGNGLVIWITAFKMTKSVNGTWYLSLAVSDFLFCASLPFYIVYLVKDDWIFGVSMCKLQSFIMFLNMFSSIFLLAIISVDRCMVVMFPVWAQNKRTVEKASVTVMLAWITSALLSTPSAIFRDVKENFESKNICFNDYTVDRDHFVTVMCRFILGFLIPFLIIITCYVCIIRKLKTNAMAKSTKPFRIMTLLIVSFFFSWQPFHIVAFMNLQHSKYHNLHVAQAIVSTLASANSVLNPFLYAFMGKEFKRKFYSVVLKIESALDEDRRSTVKGTSITNSGEGKLSTVV